MARETPFELEPIGYLDSGMPVWPVRGAEGDDDDDDSDDIDPTGGDGSGDDDDDDADGDDDAKKGKDGKKGDDDKAKKYEPPSEEEWRRTQAALTRANTEAKRHRLKAKELAKKEGGDDAATKAAEEAEKKFKPVAIRSAAKAGFLEAGLNDASPDRVRKLLRLIDMDEVDVDEDGDVVGLDTQIDGIKADYPELFRPAGEQRKRPTRLDASGKPRGDSGKPKSMGEKIAADLGV